MLVVSGLVLVEWNGVLYVFDGIHQPMVLLINQLSIMYSLVHIYRPFLVQGGLGVHAVVPYGELFSHRNVVDRGEYFGVFRIDVLEDSDLLLFICLH